jgi:hypothetical protein
LEQKDTRKKKFIFLSCQYKFRVKRSLYLKTKTKTNQQKVRFEADFEGNSEREEKEKKKKKTPITNCKIEIEINTLIHAYPKSDTLVQSRKRTGNRERTKKHLHIIHKLLAVISQSKCLPPS